MRDEVDDEVEANVIILDYNEAIDEMLMIHAEVIDETEVLQVEVVIVDEADDDDELDIVIDEMVEVECNDEADEIDEIELLDVDDIDENDDKWTVMYILQFRAEVNDETDILIDEIDEVDTKY